MVPSLVNNNLNKILRSISFCFVQILLAPQSGAHIIAPHRDPTQSNPTYSSIAEKGQTKQDQNAGIRSTMQNWTLTTIFSEKKTFAGQ